MLWGTSLNPPLGIVDEKQLDPYQHGHGSV